ncbi:MAG: MoxR family ATPase [Saprospiraceae bacterium]|nr:MoxR family ATPase [Saprospiraceae bacterium]MCB9324609.1 MoxR family ATPase [Lewinellaceae bacterium]
MSVDELNENLELENNDPQVPQVNPIEEATPAEPPVLEPGHERWQQSRLDLSKVANVVNKVKNEVGKVIVGQDEYIELLLTALFTGGHVLVEGVPGIAKTLMAKLMAKTLDTQFSRIQFTPDLMPSDVIGTTVFNMKTSEFTFKQGPIFANVILVDEINRAPAKTQAAMFEVMEEHQVTADGVTYAFEFPFFVVATQNPIEQEGTYKLPEAQLDRFIFKIHVDYPDLADEKAILKRFSRDFDMKSVADVSAVFTTKDVRECRELIEQVHIKDQLLDYIAGIVHETRNNPDLFLGASPRASLAIMKTSKAVAAMNGRDFVTPDDIQYVAYPVLNHRVILTPEREMEGIDTRSLIRDIMKSVEVPR